MKELLKRLFAFFFLGKKNKDIPHIGHPDPQGATGSEGIIPPPSIDTEKKPAEKKSDDPSLFAAKPSDSDSETKTTFKPSNRFLNRKSMKNNLLHVYLHDRIVKYRCTSLERAKEIVAISAIGVFCDSNGNQYNI